jgi:hypothetical protein
MFNRVRVDVRERVGCAWKCLSATNRRVRRVLVVSISRRIYCCSRPFHVAHLSSSPSLPAYYFPLLIPMVRVASPARPPGYKLTRRAGCPSNVQVHQGRRAALRPHPRPALQARDGTRARSPFFSPSLNRATYASRKPRRASSCRRPRRAATRRPRRRSLRSGPARRTRRASSLRPRSRRATACCCPAGAASRSRSARRCVGGAGGLATCCARG